MQLMRHNGLCNRQQHQRRHPYRFSIAETLLPQWGKQLQRLFPKLEISLYQGTHLEVRDWVKQGITDSGITILARETFPQADFHDLRLRSLEPALFRTLQLIAQKDNPHPAIYEALATIIMTVSNES